MSDDLLEAATRGDRAGKFPARWGQRTRGARERMRTHTKTGYGKFPDPAPALGRVAAAVGLDFNIFQQSRAVCPTRVGVDELRTRRLM